MDTLWDTLDARDVWATNILAIAHDLSQLGSCLKLDQVETRNRAMSQ
jgi:hypothetical protein